MYESILNVDRLEDVVDVFGSFDSNVRLIEQHFDVRILNRGPDLRISGEDALAVARAEKVLNGLFSLCAKGEPISEQNVRYCISLVDGGAEDRIAELTGDVVCVTAKGKPVKAKTIGQKRYVEAIRDHTVTVGVGPAGTGKTYLAVACAVAAFREKKVNRIILTRPAVEAGEKLGFLPGDLMNKVDPYLQPLYDALFDMLGAENYHKYLERGNIEVAPLAYMRGRTLDDSFIILDEAQNTTPEQ
ncbi:MAG: PhoH family protein, partial [Oscillospiraceae bacterium]|nr:PhoH family protein [Oscillospiraceae bacterium]